LKTPWIPFSSQGKPGSFKVFTPCEVNSCRDIGTASEGQRESTKDFSPSGKTALKPKREKHKTYMQNEKAIKTRILGVNSDVISDRCSGKDCKV